MITKHTKITKNSWLTTLVIVVVLVIISESTWPVTLTDDCICCLA